MIRFVERLQTKKKLSYEEDQAADDDNDNGVDFTGAEYNITGR